MSATYIDQFWNKEITKNQRDEYIENFIEDKFYANSEGNELKPTLLNLMSDKKDLDWSWWQYKEIHFMDLYKFMDKQIVLEVVRKYFMQEIKYPLDIKN